MVIDASPAIHVCIEHGNKRTLFAVQRTSLLGEGTPSKFKPKLKERRPLDVLSRKMNDQLEPL